MTFPRTKRLHIRDRVFFGKKKKKKACVIFQFIWKADVTDGLAYGFANILTS
jgi:hypothetical protein